MDDWREFLVGVSEARLEPGASVEEIEIAERTRNDDALATTLVVSDEEDGAPVLLNPAVVDEDGEWEAWFFAHWVRARSQSRISISFQALQSCSG